MHRLILAFLFSLAISIGFIVIGYLMISFIEWSFIELNWIFIRKTFLTLFTTFFILAIDYKRE